MGSPESDMNTKVKGRKSVEKCVDGKYILKPDELDYDEFSLMEYDVKLNLFRANRQQPKEKKEQIDRMINEVLGLNYGILPKKRKEKILQHKKMIKFGEYDWNSVPFGEFPTAIKMFSKELNF